jgi:NAD(P)-dependent dehydrogenase (short-subunit alcohol dehydrogenase family)
MSSPNTSPVWLVTGCSTGIGKSIVVQALDAGQRVIATGRSAARLTELEEKGAKVLEVDVNAAVPKIEAFAKKVLSLYGRIDVLVNNAGYVQLGTVEEAG